MSWCNSNVYWPIDVNSIAVLDIYGLDYLCISSVTTKSEAINLLKDAGFSEKSGIL